MTPNLEQIRTVLAEIKDPNTDELLNIAAESTAVQLENTDLYLTVTLGYPIYNGQAALRKRIETAVEPLGVTLKQLRCDTAIAAHAVQRTLHCLPHVRNILAVASGKGGGGKSTAAVTKIGRAARWERGCE